MKDRVGQAWEFDLVWHDDMSDAQAPYSVVYIAVSSRRAPLHETDGKPATAHTLLNTDDGSVSTWWELDAQPYESCGDRRRLA